MKKAAFMGRLETVDRVYGLGRREALLELADFYPHLITAENFVEHAAELEGVEVIFSTWGMLKLTPQQIDYLPNLKAVFYAAGSVQGFTRPLLERGIEVFSAWTANGIPVAEWTLAQILLSNKGYFANERAMRAAKAREGTPQGRGNFGARVCLLGMGAIGRRVIELLKPFHLDIAIFDPYISDDQARAHGVRKVELDEAFATGNVVSNHLANLPATVGLLTGAHFASMPRGATFINTGRGATLRENELIEVLRARPDLTALLDVTHPEPPLPDSPLWTLENVFLSAHLAGSIGDEVVRMADYMIEEFESWQKGEPTRFSVSLAMLETMA